MPDLNWTGFYFMRGPELVLRPCQGHPTYSRIPLGKAVCGTAAAQRRSVLLADVDAFQIPLACDSASRSEIALFCDNVRAYRQDSALQNVIDWQCGH